jgi:hypothetical protein
MAAPTSALVSEIYLQHLKHKKIVNLLMKYKTIGNFPYVDGFLIIYITNITNVYHAYNNLDCNISFKSQPEYNKKLNSLDVIITVHIGSLQYCIFIKPTTKQPVMVTKA